MMNVLHVWNTSGVASVIAKFMDKQFDTKSIVITRRVADRAGLTTYGKVYDDGAAFFFVRALVMARKADIVHVHALDRIVPWVRRLYPRKPVIIHYLGTDIKDRWKEKQGRWRKADLIAYCTPNLSVGAPQDAIYVPIPVDTDVFYPRAEKRDSRGALSFRYGMDEEAREFAKVRSLDLTLLERWTVPHNEMPVLLCRFAYYIDLRKPPGLAVADSVGKAALEALACGCSVIDWSGKVIEGFPPEHDPNTLVRRWHDLYEGLIEKKRGASGGLTQLSIPQSLQQGGVGVPEP